MALSANFVLFTIVVGTLLARSSGVQNSAQSAITPDVTIFDRRVIFADLVASRIFSRQPKTAIRQPPAVFRGSFFRSASVRSVAPSKAVAGLRTKAARAKAARLAAARAAAARAKSIASLAASRAAALKKAHIYRKQAAAIRPVTLAQHRQKKALLALAQRITTGLKYADIRTSMAKKRAALARNALTLKRRSVAAAKKVLIARKAYKAAKGKAKRAAALHRYLSLSTKSKRLAIVARRAAKASADYRLLAGPGSNCKRRGTICLRGWYCHGAPHSRRCMKYLKAGSRCDTSPYTYCGPGYQCGWNVSVKRCVRRVGRGKTCGTLTSVCQRHLQCRRHHGGRFTCVQKTERLNQCGVNPFLVCRTGLKCSRRKICVRPMPRPVRNFVDFNKRRAIGKKIQIDQRCRNWRVRTYSGFCNNLRHSNWGAANTTFYLLTKPQRHNFAALPNARVVSNAICREHVPRSNRRGMSELVMFWGQFIDHAVTFTDNSKVSLPIKVPAGDPVFQPGVIHFFRTQKRGKSNRESPINFLSSYLDAANVYGSTVDIAIGLRSKSGGMMRLPGNVLPRDSKGFFEAGDVRVNENPMLTTLHTIFAREHNRVASEVLRAFPKMKDEEVYQLARLIVGAEQQAIVYYEWLPAVLGRRLRRYRRYHVRKVGAVSNEFSTIAFRVGHTMINPFLTSVNARGRVLKQRLRSAFFNTKMFLKIGPESFLRGAMRTAAAEVDAEITTEVRNFLVGEGTGRGISLDLAALNIQRGRDNNIPSYNALRRGLRMRPARRFSDITSNVAMQRKLASIYKSVHRVDAWVGGVCEDHKKGGSLGPLFAKIWAKEFERLRDADRFYFEKRGVFTRTQIKRIPTLNALLGNRAAIGRTMKRVIVRNTALRSREVSDTPFFVTSSRI